MPCEEQLDGYFSQPGSTSTQLWKAHHTVQLTVDNKISRLGCGIPSNSDIAGVHPCVCGTINDIHQKHIVLLSHCATGAAHPRASPLEAWRIRGQHPHHPAHQDHTGALLHNCTREGINDDCGEVETDSVCAIQVGQRIRQTGKSTP